MAVCDPFTSVLADTGENMNLKPNAIREKAETDGMIPGWVQTLKPSDRHADCAGWRRDISI